MNKQFLSFGKYKGRTLTDIIKNDLKYCVWLIKNVKYNPFSRRYPTFQTDDIDD